MDISLTADNEEDPEIAKMELLQQITYALEQKDRSGEIWPTISNAEFARKLLLPYTVERKKALTTDGTDLQPAKEPKAIGTPVRLRLQQIHTTDVYAAREKVKMTFQEKICTLESEVEHLKSGNQSLLKDLAVKSELLEIREHAPCDFYCTERLTQLLMNTKAKVLEITEKLRSHRNELTVLQLEKKSYEEEMRRSRGSRYEMTFDKIEQLRETNKNIQRVQCTMRELEEEHDLVEDKSMCILTVLIQLLGPKRGVLDVTTSQCFFPKEGSEKILQLLKLENQRWFWSQLQNSEACALMESLKKKGCPCGSFLVRNSHTKPGNYVLHLVATELQKSKVFLINRYDDGKYGFSEKGKMFDSIIDLVEYYRMSSLRDLFPGIDVTLQHPIPKPKPEVPVAVLREKIKDLEKQLSISESTQGRSSKPGHDYINLDRLFSDAITLPKILPAICMEMLSDYIPQMSHLWDHISCRLGMEGMVKKLRHSEKSTDSKFLEVLQAWSGKIDATWEKLLEAVYSAGLQVLACKLAGKLKDVATLFSGVL